MKNFFLLFLILGALNSRCYPQTQEIASPSPYQTATNKLTEIPKELKQKITGLLKNGYKNDIEIIKLVDNNRQALDDFKKITALPNNGTLLPGYTDEEGTPPDLSKELQLFRLLLIEAKINESEGRFREAQDDYLAAARFILQLSKNKHDIFIFLFTNSFAISYADQFLQESINNPSLSKKYKGMLLAILQESLTSSHSAIDSGFRELAENQKRRALAEIEAGIQIGLGGFNIDQIVSLSLGKEPRQQSEMVEHIQKKSQELFGEGLKALLETQLNKHFTTLASYATQAVKEKNVKKYESMADQYKATLNSGLKKALVEFEKKYGQSNATNKEFVPYVITILANNTVLNKFFTIESVAKTIERYQLIEIRLQTLINKIK